MRNIKNNKDIYDPLWGYASDPYFLSLCGDLLYFNFAIDRATQAEIKKIKSLKKEIERIKMLRIEAYNKFTNMEK